MTHAIKHEFGVMCRQDSAYTRHPHKIYDHLDKPLIGICHGGLTDLLDLTCRELEAYTRSKANHFFVRKCIPADGLAVRIYSLKQTDSLKELERERFVEQLLI